MRLFWSTLVVLAFASVHSFEISPAVPASLLGIRDGENLYAIYKVTDGTLIEIEFTGGREKTYDDFIADLRRTDPSQFRFGIMYYEYIENEMPTHTLVLILWSPETLPAKERLAYEEYLMTSITEVKIASRLGIGGFLIATKDEDLIGETLLSRLTLIPAANSSQSEGETSTHAVDVSQ